MQKITKSDAQWQTELSPEEYDVARQKGTERAFTGRYWDHHEHGIYRCVGCGTALFASDTKFDAGWDGRATSRPSTPRMSAKNGTHCTAWFALKSCAMSVTATWATFSQTARLRLVCGTALIRFP